MSPMTRHWHDGRQMIDETAATLRLLADPTRLRILGLLQPGEQNVTALCEHLGLAQPTVSHHLGLMRNARMLTTRRAGKQIYYALNPSLVRPGSDGELHVQLDAVDLRLGPPVAARHETATAQIETKPVRPVRNPMLTLSGTA